MKLFSFASFIIFIALSFSNNVALANNKQVEKPPESELFLNSFDTHGKAFNLKQFAGKTVLISFYSAGCSLCGRDIKLMRDFYRDNMHKNFVLIGVNLDQSKRDFDSYTHLINLAIPKNQRFPIIWRNNAKHKDNFGTMKAEPTHFLIDAKGQLILKREGTFQSDDWDNLWEALNS